MNSNINIQENLLFMQPYNMAILKAYTKMRSYYRKLFHHIYFDADETSMKIKIFCEFLFWRNQKCTSGLGHAKMSNYFHQ